MSLVAFTYTYQQNYPSEAYVEHERFSVATRKTSEGT